MGIFLTRINRTYSNLLVSCVGLEEFIFDVDKVSYNSSGVASVGLLDHSTTMRWQRKTLWELRSIQP